MLRSTFAGFTSCQLAIRANQNALAVVGQNMANVKTPGYTRQRLDQVSMNLRGNSALYQNIPTAHIGYGVEITGLSQIRDPFLDSRYRIEMGNLSTEDQRLSILNELGTILDETTRSAVVDQFTDLTSKLKDLQNHVGDEGYDNMVRSSAKTLTDMFNLYSKQLEEVRENSITDLKGDVKDVNDILSQIQQLNISIRNSQVHGNSALELQDDRNALIDQLSTYGKILVTHTTDVTMTGAKIDVTKIELLGKDSSGVDVKIPLIDDNNPPAQFTLTEPNGTNTKYGITIQDSYGGFYEDFNFDKKGSLESAIGMLNDAGEFSDPGTSNRGIGYYQNMLDTLARTFAKTMNDLNVTAGPSTPPNDKPGNLFEANGQPGAPITAANLTVSQKWLDGEVRIVASQAVNAPSSDPSNIENMLSALTSKQKFTFPDPSGAGPDKTAFEGNFQDCYSNMVGILSLDTKSTETTLDNYLSIVEDIADSKDSVSGVNLDEEGMNMMQYNKALSAASRLMTTLDEMLNVIINSMGLVGR